MSIVQKAIGKLQSDKSRAQVGGQSDVNRLGSTERHKQSALRSALKLDYNTLREAGLIPPKSFERKLADEYRRIKRPLLDNVFGKAAATSNHVNVIGVTSSLSGEGKTFTALNLALSMILEPDVHVLLVDCDVAKPHLTKTLGIDKRPGWIDFLADQSLSVSDLLVDTDLPALKIIPAGRQHEHATELLASKRMERLILELSSRYPDRIVIVDTPPLLITSEAPVLISFMGQVVIVVQAGETPIPAVQNAIELVDNQGPVNLVLNKGTAGSGQQLIGYDYGYGT